MAWVINKEGCRFIAVSDVEVTSGEGNFLRHEVLIDDIKIYRKYSNITTYSFYNDKDPLDRMCLVDISDIISGDGSFTSGDLSSFEDWINNILYNCSDGSGSPSDVNVINTPLEVVQSNVIKTPTHSRTTGNNTYIQPFKAFSLTAYSNDITINGESIERGQVVNLDYTLNSLYDVDQVVTGSDYFITYTV